MRTVLAAQNGIFHKDLGPGEVGRALGTPGTVLWLDLCDPDDEDIALLHREFKFHPLAIEDATRSHERPKVDTYTAGILGEQSEQGEDVPEGPAGSYYFVVFYATSYSQIQDQIVTQAVSMFIGANYLVTVHRGTEQHIDETLSRWQTPNSPLSSHISTLVHAMLDALVDDYFPLMDRVADRVEDLEDSIFVSFDQSAIHTIFGLKKSLLSMRRVVAPERDVLNVLLRRQLPIFSPEDTVYLQDVYDHIVRVIDSVDTYRDLLSSALDSYLSLQSNNLNQVMKIMTMASIVLMADALIAGIYGMNFRFMPELNWGIGYVWALLLMVVVSSGLIVYYRIKRWL